MRVMGLLVTVAVIALAARPASALDNQFHACFSPSVGWGVPAPVIDGVLSNDSAWNQGFRYRFANGVADADVALQATSAGSKIYISIEVQRDATYDHLDEIVIAFASGGRFHRIIVHPSPDAASPPGPPLTVTYDTTTTSTSSPAGTFVTWPSPPTDVTPAPGAVATTPDDSHDGKFRAWTTGSGIDPISHVGSWITEIAIPIGTAAGQVNLPNATDIGMYVAVVRANNFVPATPTYDYYSWPDSLWGPTKTLNLDAQTPDVTKWGVARIADTTGCTGLHVTALRTLDPDNMANTSEISRTHGNGFQLSVKNESVNAANAPVTVTGVTAKFSVGHWGVPLDWRQVEATPAATPVANDGASHDLTSGSTYIPTAADLASGHVCLMGEIDSTMGTATISQKSMIINTHWGPASSFEDHPLIESSKLKPLDGATTNRLRIRYFPKLQFAFSTGEIAGHEVGKVVAQLDWTFEVMHITGRTLIVSGAAGPVNVPLGSFRQIIQHEMPIDFANAFTTRHQEQRTRAARSVQAQTGESLAVAAPAARQRMELLAQNAMLAADPEKPAPTDFSLTIKGLTPVRANTNVFEIEVPQGQDVPLDTVAEYAVVNTVIQGCCPGPGSTSTTPKATTLGMVVLVGVMIRRRRRP